MDSKGTDHSYSSSSSEAAVAASLVLFTGAAESDDGFAVLLSYRSSQNAFSEYRLFISLCNHMETRAVRQH
jgi:hypothetical protein